MKMLTRVYAPVCLIMATAGSAHAQFYKLHNVDIGGGAIGQFTTPLTTNNPTIVQGTNDTLGGMFTVREHPVSWAGVEFNYGYHRFSEYFNAPTYQARTKTNAHEATVAYLFHPHMRKLQPFVSVGGGAIDFIPSSGQNQWRWTGLVEAGLDIPTSNPHFGFRLQGRSLIYRAPNFKQPNLASKSWVATNEPSLGVWYRF